MAHWYAVYTRPRYEKKVADSFLKKNLESYCPLNRAGSQWMGARIIYTALFTSYVFVRMEQRDLTEVKKVDGVINLVYWMGKPVVIRDIEIEMIRRFLSVHKNIQLEKTAVKATEMVKLIEAPLMTHKEGEVIAVDASTATLYLPSLGFTLTAQQYQHIPFLTNMHTLQQNVYLQ